MNTSPAFNSYIWREYSDPKTVHRLGTDDNWHQNWMYYAKTTLAVHDNICTYFYIYE